MIRIVRSATFTRWIRGLGDRRARVRINARLRNIETTGHLGDAKAVGGGVLEMRIHYGPGYRLYFIREGRSIIILLCGGDKDSQTADIGRAKRIAAEWKEQR